MLRYLPSREKRDVATLTTLAIIILGVFTLYFISNLAETIMVPKDTPIFGLVDTYFILCMLTGISCAVLSATFIYLFRHITIDTPFKKIFAVFAALTAICGLGLFIRGFSPERDPWFTYNIMPFISALFILCAITMLRSVPGIMEFLGKLKQAEARIEILNTTNRDLESFASNLTHDLRCPLRAIGGYSRVLEEDYGDKLDEEGKQTIGKIHKNVDKMSVLIDGILRFAKCSHQRMVYEDVDVNEIVNSAFDTIKENINGRNVHLDMQTLHPIKGDPLLLRQIFMNLLTNAVKFTNSRPEAVIHLSSREKGTNILYYLKDNGIGFEQRYAGKVFKAFQRLHTDAEFEGTGIGLSIVESLVHRHGGKISVEGNPGNGAAFYISLPKERVV